MPSPQPIREEVALGSALGSKNNRFGLPTTAIKLVRPGVSQTERTEVDSFGYAEGTKVTHSGTCATRQRKCGLSAVNRGALSINGAREPAGCQLSGAFLPPRNARWPLGEHFPSLAISEGLADGQGSAAHGTRSPLLRQGPWEARTPLPATAAQRSEPLRFRRGADPSPRWGPWDVKPLLATARGLGLEDPSPAEAHGARNSSSS